MKTLTTAEIVRRQVFKKAFGRLPAQGEKLVFDASADDEGNAYLMVEGAGERHYFKNAEISYFLEELVRDVD